jgi:O-succinylbenzoate synthase
MFPYQVQVVTLPIKTNFQGLQVREIALFEGPAGWSEFSPFIDYSERESSTWLKAAIESATTTISSGSRDSIPINATILNPSLSNVAQILEDFPGCNTVKIKLKDHEKGRAIISEVIKLIPSARIRIDVNGSWSLNEAIRNIKNYEDEFADFIDYFEQPCSSILDLKSLKKSINTKIAVDESIRKNLESDLSMFKEFADVAIIKWAPSGGITAALNIIEKIQLPVVISSALDSSIGISHGLTLASQVPNLYGPCGLGTVALLKNDVTSTPLIASNGVIKNRRIIPDRLDALRASNDRQIWWQDRINTIYKKGLI